MAVFHFRLQTLLERRIEARQQAEENLAARRKELAIEKQMFESLEAEAKRAADLYKTKRLERLSSAVRSGSRLTSQNDFVLALKLALESAQSGVVSQQVFVDQAEEMVREAEGNLAECRREVDLLEKYREKAEGQFLQELAYKEELEQDEIGNVMHLSKRKRS